MIIRKASLSDIHAINKLVKSAFADVEHSDQNETNIIDGLRAAHAITVELVALQQQELVGYIAFSEVLIDKKQCGWYGLGPLAVDPSHQRAGIGRQLINEGLTELRKIGASGCVVLGDPEYYARFGFEQDKHLLFPGVPAQYFRTISLADKPENFAGTVEYNQAFYDA